MARFAHRLLFLLATLTLTLPAQAQNQGSPESAYLLGLAYLNRLKPGETAKQVPLDVPRGIELLTQAAADQDYRKAASDELRRVYAKGLGGVPANLDKEAYWWEYGNGLDTTRARAQAGDSKAAAQLGLAYLQFEHIDEPTFKDSPIRAYRNRTAESWLSRAAAQGSLSGAAAEGYGCLYLQQPGIASDPAKARKWVETGRDVDTLKRLSDAGDAEAMVKTGDTYFDSCLRDTYRHQAFPWYRQAVAHGNIKRAWRLMDEADTLDEKRHWAEIAAAIKSPDGTPAPDTYGGERFFDNLEGNFGQDIPWGFRHAPGTRYLSLQPLQVHLKPDAASPIIQDIGRWKLVYARACATPGWLAAIASSIRDYPDTFGYVTQIDEASVERFLDQKADYRLNRQAVQGLVGYIRQADLASLDALAPLPVPQRGLVPVRSVWQRIGVQEDRQFITDFNQGPYDALVRIKVEKGSCSGTFILEPTLVVTAGHCASTRNRKETVQVIIERSPSQKEVIPATWIKHVKNDSEDWGILRLRHKPQTPVTPLRFADDMNWSSASQLSAAAIGYPGDLFKLSESQLGFIAPSIKHCVVDISRHHYTAATRNISFNHYCHVWFGDSGGPLLVWNPRRSAFEVLAVHANVSDGFQSKHRATLFGASRFKALMYEQYKAIEVPLLQNDQQPLSQAAYFEAGQHADQVNPGVSTVTRAYRERVESLFTERSTLGIQLIEAVRQQAGVPAATSPRLDDPDKLGFWRRGPTDTYDSVESVSEARLACIGDCDKAVLRNNGWTLSHGENVDLKQLAKRDDTMVIHALNAIVVGGDLFHVGNDNRVDGVARQFMNLKESGAGFDAFYQSRYREPAEAIQSDDFALSAIAATTALHSGPNFGGETPTTIAGGQVIGTAALAQQLATAKPPLVLSSIGGSTGIPGAINLRYASEGGSFTDATQQRLAQDLERLTEGDKSRALVFYCHHNQCWMSYNSALRAIQLGYKQVYWYRGGIKSWIRAGYPLDWLPPADHNTAAQDGTLMPVHPS
ncbi:rhodanese-like domain-containing protein [Pseudomonas sp. NPDC090755]|uniref:rhodanese-like domain-containing protein n=1 Tax=Pseudomonas sp. NPDC090755 TaxID=3364481 RepID=UPI00383B46CF